MSTLEKQIKSFLGIENLPISEETNYQILQNRWDASSHDSDLEKQIENRMMELNKEETDYQILQNRWEASPDDSNPRTQIENRMMELNKEELPKIVDYQILQNRWDASSHDSDLEKQIENRMMELNKEETDYQILQNRWEASPDDSNPRTQIENRMMELISLVSKENIPNWFSTLVKTQVLECQPSSVQSFLKEKCQEILAV